MFYLIVEDIQLYLQFEDPLRRQHKVSKRLICTHEYAQALKQALRLQLKSHVHVYKRVRMFPKKYDHQVPNYLKAKLKKQINQNEIKTKIKNYSRLTTHKGLAS